MLFPTHTANGRVLTGQATTWLLARLFLCLLLMATSVRADVTMAPPVATLAPQQGDLLLETFLQQLEDPDGTQTLNTLPHADWQPLPADGFNPGFSRSVWWLRLTVRNPGQQPQALILDTDSSLADYLDMVLVRSDGQAQRTRTGDRRPFDSRALETRTFALPFTLAAGEQVTLYLRQSSHDGLQEVLRPHLWQAESFTPHLQQQTLLFGLFFGTLVAVILYNLFVFLSAPERTLGLYLLYVTAMLFWAIVFRGYGLQYLWPKSPAFNNQVLPLMAGVCYCIIALFSQEYLQLRKAPRWMYRLHRFATLTAVLALIPPLFGIYALAFAWLIPVGSLIMISTTVYGILLWRRGSRPALYFLMSFALLSLGVLLYFLRILGWLEPGLVAEYGMHLGSFLQVLLLALGVADQTNTLKAEKLKAEQQARTAEHALTTQLAVEVRQRTEELQLANQRLNTLAITDELTGAFNRRHFNQMFDNTCASHRRLQVPFAFCMIDIDHFKSYNDLCGHQAGDDALRRVSACLRAQLKRETDLLFRLGGEEFALVMPMEEPARKAPPFAEQLRAAIEALQLPHPGSSFGHVTASFGLLIAESDAEPITAAEAYSRADALLYQAKSAGRNRVISAQSAQSIADHGTHPLA